VGWIGDVGTIDNRSTDKGKARWQRPAPEAHSNRPRRTPSCRQRVACTALRFGQPTGRPERPNSNLRTGSLMGQTTTRSARGHGTDVEIEHRVQRRGVPS
jgi:hypothetical protein